MNTTELKDLLWGLLLLIALAVWLSVIAFLFYGCDNSMNDSWLNPPSCDRKDCMEAEGYNIVGSPSD